MMFVSNNDLISREALRNVILNDRKLDGANANWEVNRILVHIEKAPEVKGGIRWTDKLFVTNSGDIIDFEGRVVGHINLEDVKGGAE